MEHDRDKTARGCIWSLHCKSFGVGLENNCAVMVGISVVTDLLGQEEAAVANTYHWSVCEQAALGSKYPALCTCLRPHYVLFPVFDTRWCIICFSLLWTLCVDMLFLCIIKLNISTAFQIPSCSALLLGVVVNTFTAGLWRQPQTHWSLTACLMSKFPASQGYLVSK